MIAIPTYLNPLLAPLLGNEMPWLLLFELAFLLLGYYWIIKLASPQRAKAFVFLQEERLRQHYQQRLGKILDRLSHWFSKKINKNQHPFAYYWSADLWGFTLLIAILYPFYLY